MQRQGKRLTNYVSTADLTDLSMRFKRFGSEAWDQVVAGKLEDRDDYVRLEAEANTYEKAALAINELIVKRKVKL